MTYEKILIEPVKLPWRLDISMTDFKLNATEFELNVSIAAFFILENNTEELILEFDKPFFVNLRGENTPYNWRANEKSGVSEYDWSLVPFYGYLKKGEFDEYHRLLNEEWRKIGSCPDSGIYFVKNSSLLEGAKNKQFKHYLLIGNDICIDVVTKKMNWKKSDN